MLVLIILKQRDPQISFLKNCISPSFTKLITIHLILLQILNITFELLYAYGFSGNSHQLNKVLTFNDHEYNETNDPHHFQESAQIDEQS